MKKQKHKIRRAQKQKNKKITFYFPSREFVYLNMAFKKQRVSLNDFVAKAVIEKIEAYEDELCLSKITDEDRAKAIPWEEMENRLGWNKL